MKNAKKEEKNQMLPSQKRMILKTERGYVLSEELKLLILFFNRPMVVLTFKGIHVSKKKTY